MTLIPYHQAKEIIEKEIGLYRSNTEQLPEMKFEREGETTKISFDVLSHADWYKLIISITEVLEKVTLSGSSRYTILSNERINITLSDFGKKSFGLRIGFPDRS